MIPVKPKGSDLRVLRYISDGEVRRPFLGFEICDMGHFWDAKFSGGPILRRKGLVGLFVGLSERTSKFSFFNSIYFLVQIKRTFMSYVLCC